MVEYSILSQLMTSITGQTTIDRSMWILSRSGSAHPTLHSQWESRNVRTSPVAALAPVIRARISPSLFECRTSLILELAAIQSSSFLCKSSTVLKEWVWPCHVATKSDCSITVCNNPLPLSFSPFLPPSPWSLKSSTSTISCRNFGGVLLTTLVMVRRRTVYASLWKMITTEVVGRSEGYLRSTQLERCLCYIKQPHRLCYINKQGGSPSNVCGN